MKKAKVIAEFICFPLIVIAIIYMLVALFSYSASPDDVRLRLFYNEDKGSIDTVFIGPSTFRCGIIPTQCFDEQGFTGYTFSSNSMSPLLYKPIVEECEIVQKPDLYVVDITPFTYYDAYVNYSDKDLSISLRGFLMSVPSERRAKYVEELIPEEERFNYNDALYATHCNWQWLGDIFRNKQQDILNEKSVLKGYSMSFYEEEEMELFDYSNFQDVVPEPENIGEKGIEIFDNFLEYIETNNINVMFIKMPKYRIEEWVTEMTYCNYLQKILEKRGHDVINYTYLEDEIGLTNTDFFDHEHLNYSGASKLTTRLAQDICDRYTFEQKSEELQAEWSQCAKNVQAFAENLQEKEDYKEIRKFFTDIDYFEFD